MGFRKGMAAFGGGILFTFLFCHFLVYADIKDHETDNSSCLIIFHHVSSKSSNQEDPKSDRNGRFKYVEEVSFLHVFLSFLGLCGYQRPRNKQFIMSYHISSRLI